MRTRIIVLFVLALLCCSCRKDAGTDSGQILYIDLCRQNLELARQGRLAEDAFCNVQYTSDGLVLDWDRDGEIAKVLSDIYYEAGHIALSQRFAFEANTYADEGYDLDMLHRLVTTNIVYGAYPVAQKYITLLEKDRKYGEWAREQRRFLWDDAAVEADPEYGAKRKCIPAEDFLATAIGIEDLEHVINANPEHRNSMDYLGVYYLLDCDFEHFGALVEKYYGTPALPVLPRSFAEAVCLMSVEKPGYWKRFGVKPSVYRRFCDFEDRIPTGLSMDKYKDTFWYYVMMMNQTQQ